jgi:DNA polymerase I-like protein with 3'-5' exonuclease and polymerase domains
MDYSIIHTDADIRNALNTLSNAKAIGFDLETTHLYARHGNIRLVQMSDGDKTYIIDCYKLANMQMLNILKPFLEAELPRKIIHNSKFEHHWINSKLNCRIKGVFDTYLAAKLIDTRKDCKLDEVLLKYNGIEIEKDLQKSDWSQIYLTPEQYEYAALDVFHLPRTREKLIERLRDERMMEVAAIEFRCAETVSAIETAGIPVNTELYTQLCDYIETERDGKAKELKDFLDGVTGAEKIVQGGLFGDDKEIGGINLNSHVQVKAAFAKHGVLLTTTDKKVLKTLLHQHPELKYLIDFREAEKLVTSYGRNMLLNIDSVTGRIHPSFWQMGAETGRFSCSKPNVQQVPHDKIFRQCFRPTDENNSFVICDYSQIELRILAHYSRDTNMCKAYREGIDLHSMTAKGAYHLDCEISEIAAKHPNERQKAKQLNFGVVYGIGAQRYADNVGIEFQEAASAIRGFYDTYKGAENWLSGMEREGVRNRFVRTLSGRKIKFQFDSEDKMAVSLCRRNSRNAPIQGTSADILKTALPEIWEAITPLGAKIVNIVHDEVVVESPKANEKEVAFLLQQKMEEAGRQYITEVPVEAEAKIGASWADK